MYSRSSVDSIDTLIETSACGNYYDTYNSACVSIISCKINNYKFWFALYILYVIFTNIYIYIQECCGKIRFVLFFFFFFFLIISFIYIYIYIIIINLHCICPYGVGSRRLCILQKGCTRLAAASDKVY